MEIRRSCWLLVLALITQLLSPAVSALAISDNGIWSVSCAGKLQLLSLPGEEPAHKSQIGDCSLCCDEPRSCTDTFPGPDYPACDKRSTAVYSYIPPATAATQRSKRHLARAPPAVHWQSVKNYSASSSDTKFSLHAH